MPLQKNNARSAIQRAGVIFYPDAFHYDGRQKQSSR